MATRTGNVTPTPRGVAPSTNVLNGMYTATVVNNEDGMKLVVNGKDFMINGMNWDYIPIGTNVVDANLFKVLW